MQEHSYLGLSTAGFHRLAYRVWGNGNQAPPVVAVHGLTRNGRDFMPLAAYLAQQGRTVVAPDIVGRGRSANLVNPAGYGFAQYMADMTALIARLNVPMVDWVGTSMGGLIGLLMASLPDTPVRRLVLNDVGPFLAHATVSAIVAAVGEEMVCPDLETLIARTRTFLPGFGPLDEDGWRTVALAGAEKDERGGYRMAYDPQIRQSLHNAPEGDLDLWSVWELVKIPVLIIRGEHSTVLTAEVAERMAAKDGVMLYEVAGGGHAPALIDTAQQAVITRFLLDAA